MPTCPQAPSRPCSLLPRCCRVAGVPAATVPEMVRHPLPMRGVMWELHTCADDDRSTVRTCSCSYPVKSCHVVSCRVMSCHVMSCHELLQHSLNTLLAMGMNMKCCQKVVVRFEGFTCAQADVAKPSFRRPRHACESQTWSAALKTWHRIRSPKNTGSQLRFGNRHLLTFRKNQFSELVERTAGGSRSPPLTLVLILESQCELHASNGHLAA